MPRAGIGWEPPVMILWGRNAKGEPRQLPWWFWWWLAITLADLSIYFIAGFFFVLWTIGVRP